VFEVDCGVSLANFPSDFVEVNDDDANRFNDTADVDAIAVVVLVDAFNNDDDDDADERRTEEVALSGSDASSRRICAFFSARVSMDWAGLECEGLGLECEGLDRIPPVRTTLVLEV